MAQATSSRAPASKPVASESQIQRAAMQYLWRFVTPWAFHCPNGGLREKAAAGRLKADGVRKGIPDIGVPLPGGKILWIEVKRPGGTLRPDQKEFRDHIILTGGMWALAYDLEGVKRALKLWGVATRESAA